MATYKEIKGVTIQTLDSDPVQNVGSWSSGGSLNQAKKQMGGAGLTPTASIVFGGVQGSPPSLATTESYNGTSWTEIGDMPQESQYLAGVGTSSAAIAIAGIGGPGDGPKGDYVQEWNGSAWSDNPNAYPFTGYSLAGAGTATAAIISGGDPARTDVNTFDGTSFTSSTAMNTGRRGHGSVGTTTANLVSCGETPRTANTELWNGSSWTEVNDYPAATQDLSMWGTSTSAIGALGYDTANTANSASWDGTSWTETADLSNARNGANRGGLGTDNTEGLVAGGDNSGVKDFTEEFGFPPPTATILNEGDLFLSGGTSLKGFGKAGGIPTGTWASGPTMNYGREGGNSGFGTKTAGVAVAGNPSPGPDTAVEHYDGTSWTNATATPAARGQGGSAGPQTAGIIMGGFPSNQALCYTYNGSSWTEIAELNTARSTGVGFGNSTDAIYAGGYSSTNKSEVEEWNGSTWTEVNDLNDSRRQGSGGGTTSGAGFVVGGYGGSPGTNSNQTEVWDGTSFSEANELNTGRAYLTGGGEATLGITFGGGPISPGTTNKTETWNGTSWTEQSDMASPSETSFGTAPGAATGTYRASGRISGSISTATEEWSVDNVLSTVTVS